MLKLASVIFSLFVVGCSSNLDKKLVQVGSQSILQSDIDRQMQIDQFFGVKRDARAVIAAMTKSAINREILQRNGHAMSESSVMTDKEKIFNLSKDNPKMVAGLLKALGSKDFAKYYAIPLLANHNIYYEFYMKNRESHLGTFFKARKFRHSIKQHRLKYHAHKSRYPVYYVRVDRDNVVSWTREWSRQDLRAGRAKKRRELAKKGNAEEAVEWRERIPKLPLGRIAAKIYDLGSSWALVKRQAKLKREDYFYAIVVLVPKKPFKQWIAPYKKQVQVKFSLGF